MKQHHGIAVHYVAASLLLFAIINSVMAAAMASRHVLQEQEVNDYDGVFRDPPKPLTFNTLHIPPQPPNAQSEFDIRADSHEVVVIRDPNTNLQSHQTLHLPNPSDPGHGPALSAIDNHN
mgnify:CR=1 FL=1